MARNQTAIRSLIDRLNVGLEPEELAQLLATTVDAAVLQRARDIVIDRDLDELQVRLANPDEEDERAQKRARDFSGWTPGEW